MASLCSLTRTKTMEAIVNSTDIRFNIMSDSPKHFLRTANTEEEEEENIEVTPISRTKTMEAVIDSTDIKYNLMSTSPDHFLRHKQPILKLEEAKTNKSDQEMQLGAKKNKNNNGRRKTMTKKQKKTKVTPISRTRTMSEIMSTNPISLKTKLSKTPMLRKRQNDMKTPEEKTPKKKTPYVKSRYNLRRRTSTNPIARTKTMDDVMRSNVIIANTDEPFLRNNVTIV